MTDLELIENARKEAEKCGQRTRGLIMALAGQLEKALTEKELCRKHATVGEGVKQEPGKFVHILEAKWIIKERSEAEDEHLKDCDGYCDWTTREIVVEREVCGSLGDTERYIRKVTRHEIVHAFLFECGLYECSCEVESWATNEEMVDWFARMGPQIYEAWKEVGALDV